jgi:phosphoribosylcarboxyaminoimidazole (NCAIR) mutase
VAVLAEAFRGERGSGRWLTAPVAARCRVGVRSLRSIVGMSGGAAWSSVQVRQVSSAASPRCSWWATRLHRLRRMIAVFT